MDVRRDHRPIRLVKTVPVRDGLRAWGAVLDGHRRRVVHAGLVVEYLEVPGVTITEIEGSEDCAAVASAHVGAIQGLLAGPVPPDAVAMGCLLEPGLDHLHATPVPVTGEIEASIRLLATPGRPTAFVVSSPEAADALEARVERHGLSAQVAAVLSVASNPLQFTDPGAEQDLATAMAAEARGAVAAGAATIVGYGSAGLLDAVSRAVGVPVLSPVVTSLLATEALVRARRLGAVASATTR